MEKSERDGPSWLLGFAAVIAAASAPLGALVAPGLHGNATDGAVVLADRIAVTASYFLMLMLVATVASGALHLLSRARPLLAALALSGMAVMLATLFATIIGPLLFHWGRTPALIALVLALSATVVSLLGGSLAVRAPHGRAVGLVVLLLALAAGMRALAWQVGSTASEELDIRVYERAKAVASFAVVVEAFGLIVALTWLGRRSRLHGFLLSGFSLTLATFLTWGALPSPASDPPAWRAILHTALSDAPGTPMPYGILSVVAIFLTLVSFILSPVSLLVSGRKLASVAPLSLSLVAHGNFDAPARALAATAAAVWCVALLVRAPPDVPT